MPLVVLYTYAAQHLYTCLLQLACGCSPPAWQPQGGSASTGLMACEEGRQPGPLLPAWCRAAQCQGGKREVVIERRVDGVCKACLGKCCAVPGNTQGDCAVIGHVMSRHLGTPWLCHIPGQREKVDTAHIHRACTAAQLSHACRNLVCNGHPRRFWPSLRASIVNHAGSSPQALSWYTASGCCIAGAGAVCVSQVVACALPELEGKWLLQGIVYIQLPAQRSVIVMY
jgi:hypothetical protein